MKNKIKIALAAMFKFMIMSFVLSIPFVKAVDLNTTISDTEKQQFNEILTPVMKIYNFVKYTASVIAVIALLFAGITYMFSGNDIKKRDTAKGMATYVIIGLVVIWAAPFVVNLLIT